MALTKEFKQKIINRHIELFDGLLRGDIDVFAKWWSDDIIIYGTAISEVFSNKQSAYEFYKSTSDQVTGMVKMHNRKIEVYEHNGYVILTEIMDFHVKVEEEWMFYHHSRLTEVWSEKDGEWWLTHVHCSYPDGYSAEGQQINPEQLQFENIKLKAAVTERTYELEQKNKELEIEVSLERIRARTMAMQQSDELLEVIKTVMQQLTDLAIEFEGACFINENEDKSFNMWICAEKENFPYLMQVPFVEQRVFLKHQEESAAGNSFYSIVYTKEENKAWMQHFFTNGVLKTEMPPLSQERIDWFTSEIEQTVSGFMYDTISFVVFRMGDNPFKEEENNLFSRVGKVFNQAYIRFLDLQKAEEQAKEAKIEAALERIRSRAMAMQSSTELIDVANIMREQLSAIGQHQLEALVIRLYTKDTSTHQSWYAFRHNRNTDDGRLVTGIGNHNNDSCELIREVVDVYFSGNEEALLEVRDEKLAEWYQVLAEVSPGIWEEIKNNPYPVNYWYLTNFSGGSMVMVTAEPPLEETKKIQKRCTAVFDLAFRRFQDLKKAEEQAKEAQIENALEKVRSRSLAMQKSDELSDVVSMVFQQLNHFLFLTDGGVTIVTDFKAYEYADMWVASHLLQKPVLVRFPHTKNPIPSDFTEEKLKGTAMYSRKYDGPLIKENWQLNFEMGLFQDEPHEFKQWILSREIMHFTVAYESYSAITVATYIDQPPTDEQKSILQRFAKVFEQSYIRFLDLQKAEAQAKEAQIEAALERVRSKTMAMHNSEDVGDTVATMFNEFVQLGIHTKRCGIIIFNEDDMIEVWTARQNGEEKPALIIGKLDMQSHDMFRSVYLSWKNKSETYEYLLDGENLISYYSAINHSDLYPVKFDISKLPDREYHTDFYFPDGAVFAFTDETILQANAKIMIRFANVFAQTYRRYLDLKKAEQQAREAEIQLSLERVRARTMAMQRSDELTDTAKLLFDEFKNLHSEKDPLALNRGFITIINEPEQRFDLWITDIDGSEIKQFFRIDIDEPTQGRHIYKAWKEKQSSIIRDMFGDELTQWLDYLVSVGFPIAPDTYGTRRINTFVYHTNGFIGITSSLPVSEEGIILLERFAKVFDLTYTRFTDLLQSETRAKQAVKDASLDRVRAEIASMRTTEDLQRITPVIWQELISLSISFIRCGVFIMDEEAQQMHCFLSTPEGRSIASFELPFAGDGNFSEVLLHWRKAKPYVAHWQRIDFTGIAETLLQQGRIANEKQYLDTLPEDGMHLHFLPFLQGMLYVGNTTMLTDSELDLIQSLAESFSTAYARYEDFVRLELAKQAVEQTLVELKQAQQQLIQSEKMASLGELTAGIAHEIQNPLNFVNNFSEVSNELIDEMKEELSTGNLKEASAIADDLKENLNKINHHGKRADAIVKGMLQHSRSSSGQKELTDLNALCDEYLRLAYHGYRSKDKSFNTKFETYLDPALPKINVISQDIGRVVLNLINNAFYAVNEKAKQSDTSQSYQTKVTVATKHTDDTIEITVSDNGNGIPASVVNKIFQPFFTTKPTGQGTGLGLSLAYDIVTKGHGGELKVETKEGKGTMFMILLPETK